MPHRKYEGLVSARFDNPAAILYLEMQSSHQELDQLISELDQDSGAPTFDLQLFSCVLFSSFQRNARAFGNPIWSRIRHTTVSATCSTDEGRL